MTTSLMPTQSPFGIWKDNWVDAQQMKLNYPDTFVAPTVRELGDIVAGTLVQVSNGSERFWANVTSVIGEEHPGDARIFHAIVDNDLVDFRHYDRGDAIQFRGRHIYAIHPAATAAVAVDPVAATAAAVTLGSEAGAAAAAAGASAVLAATAAPAPPPGGARRPEGVRGI